MRTKRIFLLLFLLGSINPFPLAAQTRKVVFLITQLKVKAADNPSLFIAGSMNNWNPADSNYRFRENPNKQYELTVNLPVGVHEYKVTRGSWATVETRANGQPVSNRGLMLTKDTVIRLDIQQWQDNFETQAKVHTASKNVQVIDTAFDMPQLNRKRRIWVYLPPGYETSRKNYPVIYMHDGQNLFDAYTAGYGEWEVDEVMDSLARENKQMAIIVGIDHGGQHRLTEYNPWRNERFGKGQGDEYVDFLVQTLKPYIDQKFRTKPNTKNTAIAGSSMGGLISMYAIAKYPGVFGKAGIFSPAFWLAPEIYEYVARNKIPKQMIYFVAGDLESNEMVPDMKKMYGQLLLQRTNNKRMVMKAAPDGKHSEWFWHREFPQFYNWIMK